MKISIITVVFNNEKTIESAIKSVLAQTYPNIEFIIVDGNSADGTIQIIRTYESSISKIISEPDQGIYDAMNKGIRAASGDVIGILNSDDLYYNETVLEEVMREFTQDPQLDILYGDLVYVKSDDTNKIIRRWKSLPYYPNFFEDGNVPPHPSVFLKANVYREAGLFDPQYKLAADYAFLLKIFKTNLTRKYINKYLVKMRLGGASNNSFGNILISNKAILTAWKNQGLKVPFLFIPKKIIKRILQFM